MMSPELQRQILTKTPKASLGLSITVFLVRMRFSSAPKTRLARVPREDLLRGGARNACSAILYEKNPKPSLYAKNGGLGATHG